MPWHGAHGVLADAVGFAVATLPALPSSASPPLPLVAMPDDAPSVDQSVTADTFEPRLWNLSEGVRSQLSDGWGVGRFAEGRLAVSGDGGVSTGVEIFAPAGTPIVAPVDADLTQTSDGAVVLALDAHWRLVVHGVAKATESSAVSAGQQLGVIAEADLPHLYVQLVADTEHLPPRVATRSSGWVHATSDPTLWWATQPGPTAASAADDSAALLRRRDSVFALAQEHYYDEPPRIERGWRHHLFDTDGRRYVDMVNNVTILGHSHPGVEAAVSRQLRLINTNSRFHYGAMVEFSERLTALLPEPLDTVFLVSTGSEANEVALRIIRAATGSRDIIAVRSAYHGWTTGTDDDLDLDR